MAVIAAVRRGGKLSVLIHSFAWPVRRCGRRTMLMIDDDIDGAATEQEVSFVSTARGWVRPTPTTIAKRKATSTCLTFAAAQRQSRWSWRSNRIESIWGTAVNREESYYSIHPDKLHTGFFVPYGPDRLSCHAAHRTLVAVVLSTLHSGSSQSLPCSCCTAAAEEDQRRTTTADAAVPWLFLISPRRRVKALLRMLTVPCRAVPAEQEEDEASHQAAATSISSCCQN